MGDFNCAAESRIRNAGRASRFNSRTRGAGLGDLVTDTGANTYAAGKIGDALLIPPNQEAQTLDEDTPINTASFTFRIWFKVPAQDAGYSFLWTVADQTIAEQGFRWRALFAMPATLAATPSWDWFVKGGASPETNIHLDDPLLDEAWHRLV